MNHHSFINPTFTYAIVGATENHEKYGWIVFDNLKRKGFHVVPVNPKYKLIDGVVCYPNLSAISSKPDVVVLVIPPERGVEVVEEVVKLGIKKIWCQPGAESEGLKQLAEQYGIEIVADGSCLMVVTNYSDSLLDGK